MGPLMVPFHTQRKQSMGKCRQTKLFNQPSYALLISIMLLGWIGYSVSVRDGASSNIRTPGDARIRAPPRVPSKSAVAKLVAKHFGPKRARQVFECSDGFDYLSQEVLSDDSGSPYYAKSILEQYSHDHFKFGSSKECDVPISRTRVQYLLHQVHNKDGGTVQCPEVGEMYESIARAAPDRTIFCETGFNVGSSAAIFLHGTFGSRSEVHSFDLNFPNGAVDFLNELYSFPGEARLHAHAGDMSITLEKFHREGNFCDVIFLDAKHPEDLELSKPLARGPATLFLYHWHFRSRETKPFFIKSLHQLKTFIEIACEKTLCDFTHDDSNRKIIRESCFGRLPGIDAAGPTWWNEILGGD